MKRDLRLLGVDGGGSKTRALVATARGRVIGRGEAGSSNHHVVGWPGTLAAVGLAVERAMRAAGLSSRKRLPFAAACLGMAGIDTPQDIARLTRWFDRQGLAPRARVVNDGELLLAAGTHDTVGVALVGGTGSLCWGRSRDGRIARSGGWGHIFGDEGSGYSIAIAALRLASQTSDGRGRADALLRAVLAHLGLERGTELLPFYYRRKRSKAEIAELAPLVFHVAARGDRFARAVVDAAAADLALMTTTVIRRLGQRRPVLVLGGSLLARQPDLRRRLLGRLGRRVASVELIRDPATGALKIAARLAAIPA